MRRLFSISVLIICVFGWGTSVCAKTLSKDLAKNSAKSDRHVIILSMDAFRWDLTEDAHTPTLDSLRRVSTYARTYPVFPSNTFPSHYSMATGLHPDHHGIVNNTFYDKELKKKYSLGDKVAVANPDFWRGEPIWNTAERQGQIANIFMWVGSETRINQRQATVWTPYTNEVSFYKRADWVVEAMTRPVDSIPNLVMWYFEQPDAIEHNYSPRSPQTRAMVEHIDSVLCYFFREIRRSPVFDKINFIVTSDHGMAELSPERYTNLYQLLDTKRIKYSIGGTPLYLEPQPDYLQECYDIISRQPHLTVFKRDSMPERYHYGTDTMRIMPLIVLPQSGWIVDFRAQSHPRTGGSHGFDPFDRDMHMVFYGSGPDFKRGRTVESFQNHNIYNILAHLLHITPAPNDGEQAVLTELFGRDSEPGKTKKR